jgi:hypothetical protein
MNAPLAYPVFRSSVENRVENSASCAATLGMLDRRDPDAIERQLAHQESNDVRRVAYMHAGEYWPERAKMMQTWADYLDELRDAGKVVPLRRENA